jgi:hypothetical protein
MEAKGINLLIDKKTEKRKFKEIKFYYNIILRKK